ncbi:MAG TPA: BamA/TamA family outer membrane protein [Puia sp.]|nr:BamA/TamA family outer membrane protein [Puia sp.]
MFKFFISLRRQNTVSLLSLAHLLALAIILSLFACTVPRKYPLHRPFVFAVKIKVEGNLKPSEKQDLATRLANQLDDSLRVQEVSIAGVFRRVVAPPVYDSANLRRSIGFMVALLNASGYFNPAIKDTIRRDTIRFHRHPERNEYRVRIDFRVSPGKQLLLDSIGYALATPALQTLAMQARNRSLLRKGIPYSKQVLSDELDRLVTLFQNHGYYRFSKQDLYIERDTVLAGLLDPTLDPFQQAALMEKLRQKREHPTLNVVVMQRPVLDSSRIIPYTIGHVTVYPDLPVLQEDTVTISNIDTGSARGFTFITRTNKFKKSTLLENIYTRPGQQYEWRKYVHTVNRFNQLGPWQQAAMTLDPSDISDSVLDATLKLYPNKKYEIAPSLEASYNTNDILTTGTLFGTAVALTLNNRNAFREAVQTTTNARGGVEFGGNFIQTTDVSLSHSIAFPKPIARPGLLAKWFPKDSTRTVISGNASYTDRRDSSGKEFFNVKSINGSVGWESKIDNKTFLLNLLNVEYTDLIKSNAFQTYLNSFPSLNLAFKTGLVMSSQFVYNSAKQHGIATDFFTASAETSGALLGFIKSLNDGALWRFVRGDVTYRRHWDWRTTELAVRLFAGGGIAYGKPGPEQETLPFYKAFFSGGPNSMRGWTIRQLGLGSANFYDTADGGILDRFGDIKLEANIEYRFPLGTVLGVKLQSALYADAGNIWDRHPIDTSSAQKGSDFQLNSFYRAIAVDGGTGLRFVFPWFLIRFDYAYKLKDPESIQFPNTWFHDFNLLKGQFQLGIGYPF